MSPLASCCFRIIAISFFWPFLITLSVPSPSNAQTQQPFLFAPEAANGQVTGIAVFVRDDQTGALTEVSGSPFGTVNSHSCLTTIVDPKGRFLYGPCGLGASMYTLNATTGAVAEVIGSPFGGSSDTRIGKIVAESTGQFVYVLKFSLSDIYPADSTVILDTLAVDSANTQLVPQPSQSLALPGTLVAVAASPHGFYILVNQNENQTYPLAVVYAILFDPATGAASAPQSFLETSNKARGLLLDNSGKNLVVSSGQNCGTLWFLQLSSTDGTLLADSWHDLPCGDFAAPLAFDPTSTYLYAKFTDSGTPEIGTRIFEVSTQTEAPSSPLPANFESELGGLIDPQGPFSFLPGTPSDGGGIFVYGVDASTGYPLAPSFTIPLFPGRALAPGPATIDLNTQPVQVPAVTLSATTVNFGSVAVGQSSGTQNVTLTNSGGLPLTLSSIQLIGANAADFSESDTCMNSPQLQPSKSCLISVSYRPSATGVGSASVVITDNASGSPQQISLLGTATSAGPPPPPAPAVTLNPNPLNFPGAVTEGTVSAPQNVVLTNSGNATLHVQTVGLGGINSGDFSVASNNCITALPANASCVVSLTFAPVGPGVRNATLTVTDDASNSPQTLYILGTGAIAAQIGIASGTGSTTASISAGQSAQFYLQAVPGAGFSGTLTFSCAGAPPASTCTVPPTLTVNNGSATPFTVTVTTSGASALLPWRPAFPRSPFLALRAPLSCLLLCAVLLSSAVYAYVRRARALRASLEFGLSSFAFSRWSWAAAVFALFLVLTTLAACGGGAGGGSTSPTSPQPPSTATATPSGTYTINVVPTAIFAGTSKQFALPTISLSLTVK